MRRIVIVVLVILLAPAASADPFSDLTKGGDACFRRAYDAAHLRKNPRQQTATILLWVRETKSGVNVGLAMTRRSDPQPLFLSASCEWGNYKPPIAWMPTFKKITGAGCVTLAVPDVFDTSSAEEGGAVLLDPSPDGQAVTVHLQDPQSMVRRAARARKIEVRLRSPDRVFLMRRVDAKACDIVKDAVTTPEPGVRQR